MMMAVIVKLNVMSTTFHFALLDFSFTFFVCLVGFVSSGLILMLICCLLFRCRNLKYTK